MILSELIGKKTTHLISSSGIVEDKYLETYQYCINYSLDIIFFNLSLIIIGLFSHNFTLTLLYIAVITPVKMFAGGAHANTATLCTILSYSIFITIIIICKYLHFKSKLLLFITFFISLFIIFFSPVDHPNKRFCNKQKKRLRFIVAICCVIIQFVQFIFIKTEKDIYANLIFLCLFVILINQIIGKIIDNRRKL